MSDCTPNQEWMNDRIEAFLDGEVSPDESAVIEKMMADDACWSTELLLAQQVRDELRALPKPVCPASVTQAVFTETRRQARVAWKDRIRLWIDRWWVELWQPTLAMSLLALIIIMSTLVGRQSQVVQNGVEMAEVQQALAEAKWTLAYLSELGKQTGQSVRHEVLETRVVEPMHHALERILEVQTQD